MAKDKLKSSSRGNGPTINLVKSATPSSGRSTGKVNSSNDLIRLAAGSSPSSRAIAFGSPSEKTTKSSSSSQSSNWSGLFQSVASGGIANLLGGGGLLTDGLSYLTSGLASLFGGGSKPTPIPLVRFQLPDVQSQTVYTTGGTAIPSTSTTATGVYGANQNTSSTSGIQKAQIVQTVKTALLTSSSLNDIIGEL